MKERKKLKKYKYINEKKIYMILLSLKGHLKYGNCRNLYLKNIIK